LGERTGQIDNWLELVRQSQKGQSLPPKNPAGFYAGEKKPRQNDGVRGERRSGFRKSHMDCESRSRNGGNQVKKMTRRKRENDANNHDSQKLQKENEI
jgi:hypothetical protein